MARGRAHAATTEQPVLEPRARTPQRLLTTLLGDYWLDSGAMVPSAAWVELIMEFGTTSAATRAALARSTRRDLLRTEKRGRNTFYAVTRPTRDRLREGARRILTFGRHSEEWDGQWTVVAFSLPEADRSLRHALTSRLRWIGLAPLYDGLWVSPRVPAATARAALAELDVQTATVLRADEPDAAGGLRPMLAAWSLERIHESYEAFLGAHAGLLAAVRTGAIDPAEALIARTTVMDEFRRFHRMDPNIPEGRMPAGWLRKDAVGMFTELYDSLGPPALARVREIIAAHSPEAAASIDLHTVADAERWGAVSLEPAVEA